MTVAARLLQQCRRGRALSQTTLGARAGVPQASIARTEGGGRDVTVGTLDRLVRAAGYRLTVIPTRSATVADAADLIAAGLATRNDDVPFRAVIQLADDLAREHGAERVVLTVTPPRATGDVRFDAFLAGVVELRLDEERLPHPKWLTTAPRLVEPWFVADWLEGDHVTVNATPTQLRARGVIIDAAELVSV